uniref:COesterase domain-containing protein n=1 Tax=Caenorhabditis tropicalis TaxID=1561998 RepID=A0A1I7T9D5_9PELO
MNWAQKTGFLFLTLNFVFCVSDFSEEPSVDSDNDVVIPTASGYLRGVRIPTKSGFLVDYFKGVPFAEKPIRLRKSQLVHRWNSVYNAQEYPPKCIPVSRPSNDSEYSEDCLYMNILKPSGLNTINKLPVVVFIHGGGFQEGDGNDASCEAFAENFVSKGMVVITIQYRLAMLGFLSLGCTDPLIPCNLGLWDMVTAFQFINKTISDFNGDINNMTLMGHSAGSMAINTNLWPEFGDDLLPDIPDILVNNTKDQKVLMGVMTLEALYFSD